MAAPVFGSLVPLVGRINSSILAINQVRWFKWSLFYQEYVEQGYADIYDPTEPGVVVALKIDGTVATYSELPTTGLVAGAVYVVGDTGRAYVWNGSAWPAMNAGIAIQGPRGYTGNGVESVSVSGNSLVFHMTDGDDLPPVYLQVLADLQGAADTAVQARDDAVDAAARSEASAAVAGTQASNADASAVAANASAAAAAQSSSGAATDRAAAETAAAAAVNGRVGAETAAVAAGQSQTDAAASATAAGQHKIAAAGSATAADTSADEAAASAAAAASARDDAAGSATLADAAEVKATEQAGLAEQYAQNAAGVIPPATSTQLGKIKLAGDLAGTAESPQIAGGAIDFAELSTIEPYPGVPSVSGAVNFASEMLGSYTYNEGWSRGSLAPPVQAELDQTVKRGSDGKIPQADIPSIAVTEHLGAVASQAAMLALTGQRGDWCIRIDRGTVWVLSAEPSSSLSSWVEWVYPTSPVNSINGRVGAIELAAADILDSTALGRALMKVANAAAIRAAAGLDQVDNTRDMDKPVSTATAQLVADFESAVSNLLDGKVAAAGLTTGVWTGLQSNRPATGTAGVVYLEF
ncbi:hypothetical protein DEU38_103188 [Rhodococcus sp. AG1013]|uniref:hypothetical protein n=1 Tax=Rhodococcus sp. AG1013 TaxID=2183996 RepID=UPI000E0A3FE3|nr:hypothetical protein [Rhodococcus sp. AG1013]RDI32455.1 hypothetical protein DEU38_103188 [Rhodococcus sp. AG1013]